MRIMVIGQCSLHWGRLENGNIGNYYITEVAFRELHRVFPEAEIYTTFQMTDEFCRRECVNVLPLEMFYSWCGSDVEAALSELGIATVFNSTGKLVGTTPYIDEVLKSDLVIDFSGELWGDHAEPVGKDRFLVGLLKDRTAQLLGKPTALLAGSQGPFSDERIIGFAREVFSNFRIAANRESESEKVLLANGFDTSNVRNFTDPAFLFESLDDDLIADILDREKIVVPGRRTAGFILCGFNMREGPYDKSPRRDDEFESFAVAVEYMVNVLGLRVVLFSHQNGFELPPRFRLINGRDFPYAGQLRDVLERRGNIDMTDVVCLAVPHPPRETKAIIRHFDLLVSGRLHGFVAGVSQYVPSVLINRGFGAVCHRNIGFAGAVGMDEFIADPNSAEDMKDKIGRCWRERVAIRSLLEENIPGVRRLAHQCFDSLRDIVK